MINFANCQQQISVSGEENALICENLKSSHCSIRGDVTKVSDNVTQLCVKVPQELTAIEG